MNNYNITVKFRWIYEKECSTRSMLSETTLSVCEYFIVGFFCIAVGLVVEERERETVKNELRGQRKII